MTQKGPSFEPWFIIASSPPEEICADDKGRYVLGLFFILLQCVVWIGASVTTQYLYGEESFHSPFLMTYVGISLLAFMLPIRILSDRAGITPGIAAAETFDTFENELSRVQGYWELFHFATERSKTLSASRTWNHKKHFLAALNIAPAMFFADFFYNCGLAHTTVASSTVLVSTSCVFVFLFAVTLSVERFTFMKVAGVLLAVLGTALTTLHDAREGNDQINANAWNEMLGNKVLLGDLFSLLAGEFIAMVSVFFLNFNS